MAAKTPRREIEDCLREMERSFRRWKEIDENGCQDPFWADGANMNLVRNHILYYRQRICEICEEHGLEAPGAKIMARPVPPEVDNEYVARADEIREKALIVLERLRNDGNYSFVSENLEFIRDKDLREHAETVCRRIARLEELLNGKEDLVEMRRLTNGMGRPDLAGMEELAERIRNLPEDGLEKPAAVQLSLF